MGRRAAIRRHAGKDGITAGDHGATVRPGRPASSEGIRASLLDQPGPTPFLWSGLSTAFLGVLWAYHGWMDLGPIAGEVKRPQRNLPIAFIVGIGIVIALYVGANIAYHLVLSQREMADLKEEQIVAAQFCARLLGPAGLMLASVAIMISVFGALNGNLLVGPRVLYAMGEDGMAPAVRTVHPHSYARECDRSARGLVDPARAGGGVATRGGREKVAIRSPDRFLHVRRGHL